MSITKTATSTTIDGSGIVGKMKVTFKDATIEVINAYENSSRATGAVADKFVIYNRIQQTPVCCISYFHL